PHLLIDSLSRQGPHPLFMPSNRIHFARLCGPLSRQIMVVVGGLVALSVFDVRAGEGNSAATPATTKLEFNRDIRPILSETCFQCHGPDKNKRQADLRLDTAEGSRQDLGGHAAIVPGKPEASELIARITSKDADTRMPLAGSDLKLSSKQIATLRQWI